jgi:hypothetical protein
MDRGLTAVIAVIIKQIKFMQIENNPLLKGASGMLGKTFICRQGRDGRLVMSNRPKRPENLTVHQLAVKSKFLQAVTYAKGQMLIPDAKAEYETGMSYKLNSAYGVAVADYLKGPQIHGVDSTEYRGQVGEKLVISATDNFKVTNVQVEIRSATNELIEEGNANVNLENPMLWVYVSKTANNDLTGSKVIVKAKDKPNNITTKEFML